MNYRGRLFEDPELVFPDEKSELPAELPELDRFPDSAVFFEPPMIDVILRRHAYVELRTFCHTTPVAKQAGVNPPIVYEYVSAPRYLGPGFQTVVNSRKYKMLVKNHPNLGHVIQRMLQDLECKKQEEVKKAEMRFRYRIKRGVWSPSVSTISDKISVINVPSTTSREILKIIDDVEYVRFNKGSSANIIVALAHRLQPGEKIYAIMQKDAVGGIYFRADPDTAARIKEQIERRIRFKVAAGLKESRGVGSRAVIDKVIETVAADELSDVDDSDAGLGEFRRDKFAAAAMQGLLADPEDIGPDEWPAGSKDCLDATARLAVKQADRLIKHLGQPRSRQAVEDEDADTLTLNVPAFIRALERAREDFKSDEDIHGFVERLLTRRGQVISTADLP